MWPEDCRTLFLGSSGSRGSVFINSVFRENLLEQTTMNNENQLPQFCRVSQSVQLLSRVQLFPIPWTVALPVHQACPGQASLSITNSWSLLTLISIESVMPSNHLILYHPLLLLPSIFPSIRVFSSESVLHIRWPKYWRFSLSISLSNEYSGLISFRIDWSDLLVVQGTLKSLLQHHSWKAPILWHSASWLWSFKPTFSLSSFTFIKRLRFK